jgi:hypothetical protein
VDKRAAQIELATSQARVPRQAPISGCLVRRSPNCERLIPSSTRRRSMSKNWSGILHGKPRVAAPRNVRGERARYCALFPQIFWFLAFSCGRAIHMAVHWRAGSQVWQRKNKKNQSFFAPAPEIGVTKKLWFFLRRATCVPNTDFSGLLGAAFSQNWHTKNLVLIFFCPRPMRIRESGVIGDIFLPPAPGSDSR